MCLKHITGPEAEAIAIFWASGTSTVNCRGKRKPTEVNYQKN